jgi:DNA-damage-inducible protein J
MAKKASLNIQLDPETKANAERLFAQFGITTADAINIFLNKALMEGGIPFDVRQPQFNEETMEAIDEVRRMKENPSAYRGYTDVDQMMEELLQ